MFFKDNKLKSTSEFIQSEEEEVPKTRSTFSNGSGSNATRLVIESLFYLIL